MPVRSCGDHCPSDNKLPEQSQNCRICGLLFHLICYDIAHLKSKLFVCGNVVFICDACLMDLDSNKLSPDLKRKKASANAMKQTVLTNDLGVMPQPSLPLTPAPPKSDKSKGDKVQQLLVAIAGKLDIQSKKLDRQMALMGEHTKKLEGQSNGIEVQSSQIDELGKAVTDCTNEARETFKFIKARKELEHERFPKIPSSLTKEMESQPPNGQFGGNRRTYSTILQSKLPVTQQPQTPSSSRAREKTISLIHDATGETVQSVKIPTPKQGKKEVQIGRPVTVPERPRVQRNANPMTKAIWVSKFHPTTKSEEIEKYIVENTDAKDKTKFKCTMLVKKDADLLSMSYVSYKIDATPEVFDILIDPENWPSDKHVREFVKMSPPRRTLDDFVAQNSPATSASNNQQNINAAGGGSNASTTPKNASATSAVKQQ